MPEPPGEWAQMICLKCRRTAYGPKHCTYCAFCARWMLPVHRVQEIASKIRKRKGGSA